jgi:hypothetical protein
LRAIALERAHRFVREIHQVGHARLHPKRHLVLVDPREDLRITGRVVLSAVEIVHHVDDLLLVRAGDAGRILNVVHRIAL